MKRVSPGLKSFSLLMLVCLTGILAVAFSERASTNSSETVRGLACGPAAISIGSSVNASLTTGDCVDPDNTLYDGYTFVGTGGDLIDINLTSEAFVPRLRLIQGSYPGGQVIATGTDPGNGSRRIGAFSIPASGTYTIVAGAASIGSSGGYSLSLETTNPRVDLIQRTSLNPATEGTVVGFSVSFTSAVTGVDPSDFALATTGVSGASVASVSGTGAVYSVAVNSGSGAGSIRLDVIDNDSVINASGIPLGGIGIGNGNFLNGPAYTINAIPIGTPTPTPTPSQTVVVTNTMDDGPGSLRRAIADVASGGTITFSSLFSTPQTIVLSSGELRILKNVNIVGPGPDLLTISGNNLSRIFNIGLSSPGNIIAISGVKVINGRAPDNDYGGGLEQNYGSLTLSNCVFTGNSAPEQSTGIGGALDFFDGELTISDCDFWGNNASATGGGIAVSNAVVSISNSTIANNAAASGGGLHVFGGQATVSGTTLSGNIAGNRGGAILAQNCNLLIDRSTISGNSADLISGIGGGISFESSSGARTAQITSTAIVSNIATPNEGGGVIVISRQGSNAAATVSLRNSIIDQNSQPSLLTLSPNSSATIISGGFNLSSDSGGGFLDEVTDLVNAAAGLAPLSDNGGRTRTHALLPSSIAIDKGNSFGAVNDQRGLTFIRPVDLMSANAIGGDGSDIGPIELQSEPPPLFATLSGRVTTPSGLGLRNAVVIITDPQGVRRTATTSSFGLYSFANVSTGVSYVISVASKRYRFAARTVLLSQDIANLDLVGLE